MILLQPHELKSRSLIKVRVTYSDGTWVLQAIEDTHGIMVPHHKEVILRGDDGVMAGFLADVKAKDDEVLPRHVLRLTHWDMIEYFKDGLSKYFWVYYGDWVKTRKKYSMIQDPLRYKEFDP